MPLSLAQASRATADFGPPFLMALFLKGWGLRLPSSIPSVIPDGLR
jgi:hypothetical protein